jgi:hypothetical protein
MLIIYKGIFTKGGGNYNNIRKNVERLQYKIPRILKKLILQHLKNLHPSLYAISYTELSQRSFPESSEVFSQMKSQEKYMDS